MASLASLATTPPRIPPKICGVCYLLDTPLADALEAALANPAVRHVDIARADELRDYDIAANTIGRHRRGDCKGAA